jgi:hypothetical protein
LFLEPLIQLLLVQVELVALVGLAVRQTLRALLELLGEMVV